MLFSTLAMLFPNVGKVPTKEIEWLWNNGEPPSRSPPPHLPTSSPPRLPNTLAAALTAPLAAPLTAPLTAPIATPIDPTIG